jgi:hypothetical protein
MSTHVMLWIILILQVVTILLMLFFPYVRRRP